MVDTYLDEELDVRSEVDGDDDPVDDGEGLDGVDPADFGDDDDSLDEEDGEE